MTEETTEPPFWLVWGEDTRTVSYKHTSPDAAEAEATRLANENVGKSYFVLCPVVQLKICAPLQVARYDPDKYIPF